jgi:hypothetical protein
MKEKRASFAKDKKGNDHPFAPYLFEDEEILWMDGNSKKKSRITVLSSDRKLFAALWITGLIIWIGMLLPVAEISVVISTSCGCIFLIGMVYVLAAFWPRPSLPTPTQTPNQGIYALTNRHLFYWNGERVIERALEHISHVHLDPGPGSQGTLTFGNGFPSWPNIDDAAYVKTMIEQARKHRLEEDHS